MSKIVCLVKSQCLNFSMTKHSKTSFKWYNKVIEIFEVKAVDFSGVAIYKFANRLVCAVLDFLNLLLNFVGLSDLTLISL